MIDHFQEWHEQQELLEYFKKYLNTPYHSNAVVGLLFSEAEKPPDGLESYYLDFINSSQVSMNKEVLDRLSAKAEDWRAVALLQTEHRLSQLRKVED